MSCIPWRGHALVVAVLLLAGCGDDEAARVSAQNRALRERLSALEAERDALRAKVAELELQHEQLGLPAHVRVERIRSLLAEGDPEAALRECDFFDRHWPGSELAPSVETLRAQADAAAERGALDEVDRLLAARDFESALEKLQDFSGRWPDTEHRWRTVRQGRQARAGLVQSQAQDRGKLVDLRELAVDPKSHVGVRMRRSVICRQPVRSDKLPRRWLPVGPTRAAGVYAADCFSVYRRMTIGLFDFDETTSLQLRMAQPFAKRVVSDHTPLEDLYEIEVEMLFKGELAEGRPVLYVEGLLSGTPPPPPPPEMP